MIKKLKLADFRPSRPLLAVGLPVAPIVVLFLWRLGSLPAFLTTQELHIQNDVRLNSIISNPFFAPWRIVENVLLHINSHSIWLSRLPSAVLGLAFLTAFYMMLKGWFGGQIAYLTTIMLGTTPLYLLLSRSAVPQILYFTPILLLAFYSLPLRSGRRMKYRLMLGSAILAVCLYEPGLVWLVAAGIILKRRQLAGIINGLERSVQLILLAIFLVLVSPLIYSFIHHPGLLRIFILLPASFSHIGTTLKDWLWMISTLLFKAKADRPLILGQLPILDAAQIGLVFFGGYVIWTRLRAEACWLFGLVIFICLLAASAGDYLVLAIALPLLAILVGLGMRYLFVEWIHIFPRNPLPKYFAVGLMAAVVFMHLIYGIRYSLVAWPAHIASQTVHVLK